MNQGINVVLQMGAFNSSGSQSDTVISKLAKPLRFTFDRFFFFYGANLLLAKQRWSGCR